MAIRITNTTDGETTLLRVDGRLTRESLPMLEVECGSAEGTLQLDLGGVTYLDSAAADFLRDLMESGAQLQKVTGFVELLLNDAGSNKAGTPPPDGDSQ